jgi:hypothetical protein
MKHGCTVDREKESTSMANTNEQILRDMYRRASLTEAEKDAERYEEIGALGNLATYDELREQHQIARRSAIRRHRERKLSGS